MGRYWHTSDFWYCNFYPLHAYMHVQRELARVCTCMWWWWYSIVFFVTRPRWLTTTRIRSTSTWCQPQAPWGPEGIGNWVTDAQACKHVLPDPTRYHTHTHTHTLVRHNYYRDDRWGYEICYNLYNFMILSWHCPSQNRLLQKIKKNALA